MQSEERRFPEKLSWNMAYDPPPLARPGQTEFV